MDGACDATGEIGWRMPLHPEYLELTKGTFADLQNASDERVAVSNYAAEFLRQFVDERPWVHMDIAGTAWGMTRHYVGKGACGFGTRMLIELARAARTEFHGGFTLCDMDHTTFGPLTGWLR